MGKTTGIQWCDSSANLQQGCEGCELVNGQEIVKCYAKTLTDRYAGRKGWPEAFEKPKIFMDRLPGVLRWQDLTGSDRPDKPWLNGLPRIVFLNDMGDTFTRGLPIDWFADVLYPDNDDIQPLSESPHQYLVLTKWPRRFANFSQNFVLPNNVWAGTSITDNKSLARIKHLKEVEAKIHWLSIEPLWERLKLDISMLEGIDWVVVGGESGRNPTPCELDWIVEVADYCAALEIPCFIKQFGSHLAKKLGYKDNHGGDWWEWPDHMRTRKMPKLQLWTSTALPQGM